MLRLKKIIILSLLVSLSVAVYSNSAAFNSSVGDDENFSVYWKDKFSKNEKEKINLWLVAVNSACREVLGEYPFTININIYRVDNAREPVPWAQTVRFGEQGVDFHIDPNFSLEEFLNDWTAAHEISHLSIPFLGTENMWFAEGYATFMQGQILIKMKEFSREEIEEKYLRKLNKALPFYQSNSSFVQVADSLKSKHRYPDLYWGSATYFVQLNKHLLKKRAVSLTDIISEYQTCCRLSDESLSDVIESIDKLVGDSYASDLLNSYENKPARQLIKMDY